MSRPSQSTSHGHQIRRSSPDHHSSHFSLEELSEDDIGYDADVEVVRPEYEDAESGNEDDAHEDEGYDSADSEDQLAHRLKALYCDPQMVLSDNQRSPKNGKKRMSKDMEGTGRTVWNGRSDLEIMELSVHTDDNPPAKRQRNGLARSKTGERIVRLVSQDRMDTASRSRIDSSTLASSSSSVEGAANPEAQDLEMMDAI